MRSYRVTISKGFTSGGLNPIASNGRNTSMFSSLIGCRVTKAGIEGYANSVEDLLSAGRTFYNVDTEEEIILTKRWPFPQIFMTDVGVFIGAHEGLFKVVNMLTSDPNNVNLSVYYEGDINWPWVCIPIQGYPAFTSGDKFIYYDPNLETYLVI